jgi:drug/metabolite transporter (DMT)-like permease
MTPKLLAALVASSSCAACGQILLKLGAGGREGLSAFLNPSVAAGLALYGAGVVLWLYALTKLPLFVVYPFTMVTLALVGLLGVVVLGERPNAAVLAGWGFAAVGMTFIWIGSRAA